MRHTITTVQNFDNMTEDGRSYIRHVCDGDFLLSSSNNHLFISTRLVAGMLKAPENKVLELSAGELHSAVNHDLTYISVATISKVVSDMAKQARNNGNYYGVDELIDAVIDNYGFDFFFHALAGAKRTLTSTPTEN